MSNVYLLEIGLEEIPARFLNDLSAQLKDKVAQFLADHRLDYEAIHPYATPRRLAVSVEGLADSQADLAELVKGPSLKIAQDKEGQWTKAAEGFTRGQGLTTADIIIKDDYIFVQKEEKGLAAAEVLKDMPEVLKQLNFPVSMTWSNLQTPFIRPIHWMVSLLNEEVVPFEFINVQSGKISQGHRFLGGSVELQHAKDYVAALKEEFVLVDVQERQAAIEAQVQAIAQDNGWQVPMEADLLEEVTALVEWPTAFYGDFDPAYLEIPDIVLITAMRDHQRYFYALDQADQLQAIFISVRNGDAYEIENVIKGNEKVIRARLDDAHFFYEDDLKHSIDYFVDQLKTVNEHAKIGSYAEKQERVEEIIPQLAQAIGSQEGVAAALAAAKIYKFDLMTAMVDEFAELQGQIGGIYAEKMGIDPEVCQAIAEQYLPNHSGGELPQSAAASLLATADKLDTLIHFFRIGLRPSGSADPYALRRQATGIVEIAIANHWDFNWDQLIYKLCDCDENLAMEVIQFLKARMFVHLERLDTDHDIISAVSHALILNFSRLTEVALRFQELKEERPALYRSIIESISRVVNLGLKFKEHMWNLQAQLAQTDSERQLFELIPQFNEVHNSKELIDYLAQISPVIDQYFEENMVNTEDETIRNNRRATLKLLTQAILEFIDPSEIISKF